MTTTNGTKCASGRTSCDAANRVFHRIMTSPEFSGLLAPSRTPRYHYYQLKKSGRSPERTFEYTTETVDGKYWCIERVWRGNRGAIKRKLGFSMRRSARKRAGMWYDAAKKRRTKTPAST